MKLKKIWLGGAFLLAFAFVLIQVVMADATGNLVPVSDGTFLQWTTSTSTTHYTLVDDAVCNGNTDYVYTASTSKRDSYYLNLASIPNGSSITDISISPCASAHFSSGSTTTLKVFYVLNGATSTDAGGYILTATTSTQLASTTFSGLSVTKNASTTLQAGVVLTSGTRGARLSNILTRITYQVD